MAEQNRYRASLNYKRSETDEWSGWRNTNGWDIADTWQDAIQAWLDYAWSGEYTVVAETPSEDGRSGIIEIQFDPPRDFYAGLKIKATLIEG